MPPRAIATPSPHSARSDSIGRRLLVNVASLGAFKVVGDVCVLVMFLVLARAFGREGIGQYSYAMALTGFIGLLANFGFEFYAVREVARDPERESALFGSFTLLGLLLCPVLWSATWLLVRALDTDALRSSVILVICAYQLLFYLSQLVLGRFKARSEMFVAGALEGGLRVFILGGVIAAIAAGASLVQALLVIPAGTAGYMLVAAGILMKTHPPLSWRLDPALLHRVLPEVLPFGVATVLKAASTKVDILMLGSLRDEAEVGTYAAAHRPVFGIITLLAVMSYAAYPVLSHLFMESRAELRKAFAGFARHTAVLCGLVAVMIAGLAEPIIHGLYGAEFEASVPALRLFSLVLVLSGLNVLLVELLGAIDRQRFRMHALVVAISVNVALNTVLIPRYGYLGALWATIASEALLLVLLYGRVRADELSIGLFGIVARVAAIGAGGYLACRWATQAIDAWAGLLAGAAAYLALALASRTLRPHELKLLLPTSPSS